MKYYTYFEEIQESKTFISNLHKKKAHWSLPECIFLQIKLVKKYRHMESDVWIKEQQNTPLLQSGENIQSLKKTGYWTCKTISTWNKKSKAKWTQQSF